MDIDERLQRITERHEALAQSVELMVAEGREQARRIDRLASTVSDLVVIVLSHENRIKGLEGRQ